MDKVSGDKVKTGMPDDKDTSATEALQEVMARYVDRPVPTIFADGVIGVASSGGVERMTLTTQVFDPAPGAGMPRIEPVAVLAVPREVLMMAAVEFLKHAQAQAQAAEQASNDAE